MLRRLHPDQPDSFAFTEANRKWAETQITKYPEGRQASAIIPLLWRAQEQEGWLSRPAIEHVCEMLDMAYIRGLEVASFYFMFQLQPVGSVANIQVCGTTSCMICGAEDLVAVCKEKIAPKAHQLSADGKFSWEEVECLGACSNAPMAQIGKDYYEDLTAERLGEIIDELAAGKVPVPGPQNGRFASEPLKGLTSLKEFDSGKTKYNASVQLAVDIGDTVKRIDGTEVPLRAPWQGDLEKPEGESRRGKGTGRRAQVAASKGEPKEAQENAPTNKAVPEHGAPSGGAGKSRKKAEEKAPAVKKTDTAKAGTAAPGGADDSNRPTTLSEPKGGVADDLKMIKGVGPKLEGVLHDLGFFHFEQIAGWSDAELDWVDQNLEGFKGRARRDDWVSQAKALAKGEETEFASRVKKGDVY